MHKPSSLLEYAVSAAGTPLHCVQAGQGELLLLIHGSLCDYRYWRWQMPEFSQHFRVVAPSLPGCWPQAIGSTMPPNASNEAMRQAALADTRYSIERHVRSIVAFCQQTAPGTQVHLVGHSRGAQVALE